MQAKNYHDMSYHHALQVDMKLHVFVVSKYQINQMLFILLDDIKDLS